tara:strand:- start:4950 stop:6191 length:1242 start_codon:yes stop_codon:yes gene_type:complete
MKNLLFLVILSIQTFVFAQEKKDFVRSSLHMHLVDDFDFENGDYLLKSYNKFQFPENYNDHTIDLRKVKLSEYELTDEEKENAGKKDNLLGNVSSEIVEESTGGLMKIQDNSMVKLQLDKYISENKIPQKLIKKWWNIDSEGSFNTDLASNRSLQSQTTEMAALAKSSGTGTVDQFNKLINNTFIVFTRLFFVSNEVAAEVTRQVAYNEANKLSSLASDLAKKAADKVYEKTSEGYSVWSTSWLYQLDWNSETFDLFTSTISDGKIDLEKLESIDFKLNFLSQEKASSLVTFSLKKEDKDRTDQDVFDLSTLRNMDKVLVKLQKENDVFKPIFPLKEGFSMAAGTKEGIEGGETFEVLETKNGEYHRIGTMKVDKDKVWNNSWTSEEIETGLTYFKKGSNKYVPGVHYVRLVK